MSVTILCSFEQTPPCTRHIYIAAEHQVVHKVQLMMTLLHGVSFFRAPTSLASPMAFSKSMVIGMRRQTLNSGGGEAPQQGKWGSV